MHSPLSTRLRYLVTGGAGFIGSHLAEALLAQGHQVVVLDDLNDYYAPGLKRANLAPLLAAGATFVEGDIRDARALDAIFSAGPVHQVFHLAARAGVRPSLADPDLYFSVNLIGTLRLLEACVRHRVNRFVFASSSSVYGCNSKIPFAENDPTEGAISPYATSKLAAEHLCHTYSHLHGLNCVCLRFFTVYGPRQRPDLAIAKFTERILNGRVIEQYGDGSTARDYTFIADIIAGLLAAGRHDATPFEIINLGGSSTHTLSELIQTLETVLGRPARIQRLPEQPGDVPRTFADISKARRLLGWSPATSLFDGIRRHAEWLQGKTGTPSP